MRCAGAVAISLLAMSGHARAEDSLYDRLWPEVPVSGRLTMSQQITDQLTALGNTLGTHLNVLSNDEIGLTFDGRRRRANVRFGSGDDERYLVFKFAGDIQFTRGMAQIQATIDLGIAGHVFQLELPEFEMAPTEVRGERGVEIRLPLFKRKF